MILSTAIEFPNLHVHIENLPKSISIFGFDIAIYGCIIAIGMLAGIIIACLEARRTGQDYNQYIDFAIYAIIFSVIGARAYYVIFRWDYYGSHPSEIINIREGGLAIYGGVIMAIITCFVYTKIKKMSFAKTCDTAILGLITGQIIGRWGNFFNREAFGEYTDGLFAMKLPVDAVRSSDITDLMRKHMETVDGVSYIQVSPTYLYESMWCLALLILLLLYRRHKKFQGEVFLMYLLGYGAGRVWIEGLRTDQLWIPGTEIPVSQVLAGTIVVVSFVLIVYNRIKIKKKAAC